MNPSPIPRLSAGLMRSSRGNDNQHHIVVELFGTGRWLFSYGQPIAFVPQSPGPGEPRVFLGPGWNFSRTTGRYRNEFLGEPASETRKKLERGEYALQRLS